VGDLAAVAAESERPAEISSLCAVFGETEVIGLLSRGTPRAEVVAGVHASVASRVASLAARLRLEPPGVFTGGVARNGAMAAALEKALGMRLAVPPEPQMTGALGAALLAADRARG
jgi:activator of 2-hydroxyglutaryl-CoA dehydratase